MMSQALIILHDREVAYSMCKAVRTEHCSVQSFCEYSKALKHLQKKPVDLVILEPFKDLKCSRDLLQMIRQNNMNTLVLGILKIDSCKDRITALEAGVDDLLVVPYHPRELTLRIRKLLRMKHSAKKDLVSTSYFNLNIRSGQLRCPWGNVLLRRKEFLILSLLLQQKNRVVPKEYILDRVWGLEETPTYSTIDVHIRRLRQKLKDSHKQLIRTSYGVGYMFYEQ